MLHFSSPYTRDRFRVLKHVGLWLAAAAIAVPGHVAANAGEALTLGSAPAEAGPVETERWVPSLSIFGGFIGQRASGDLRASPVLGPSLPDPSQPIFRERSGSDTMISAVVGGSVELMTPRLLAVAGDPRVFAHADVAGAFGFRRSIAGEKKPGEMNFEPGDAPNPGEEVVTGQGTRLYAETDSLLVTAGAGFAFTFEIWERTIRVKPSVEYIRETLELLGQVHRAVQTVDPGNSNDDFRFIQLSSGTSEVYHGLGPGIEFEGDVSRAGPFILSVYLSGQGYRFLGDLDVHLSDTNEFGESAEWNFAKQEWGWGGRVGLRFRWLPE